MSKTVPTGYTPPSLARYGAGGQIIDEDALVVTQNAHAIWRRTGERGQIFVKPLNAWQTTSSTYTQDDSGTQPLSMARRELVLQFVRPILVAGVLSYQLRFGVYGRDFIARLTVYSPDAAGSLSSVEVTRLASAGWGRSSSVLTLSAAAVGDGGVAGAAPRVLGLYLEAKRSTTMAEIWSARAREVAGIAANLPNGA